VLALLDGNFPIAMLISTPVVFLSFVIELIADRHDGDAEYPNDEVESIATHDVVPFGMRGLGMSLFTASAKYSSDISLRSLAVPRSMQLRESRWQRSACSRR
jgi:hypothetical protein